MNGTRQSRKNDADSTWTNSPRSPEPHFIDSVLKRRDAVALEVDDDDTNTAIERVQCCLRPGHLGRSVPGIPGRGVCITAVD